MTKEGINKKFKTRINQINNSKFLNQINIKLCNNKKIKLIEKNKNDILKISIINILINICLFCFKLFAGVLGKSFALITDAFHSFSDIFISIIVIIGVKISSKKEDKKFQYGYDRFESIAAIVLSFILFLVGIFIAYEDLSKLLSSEYTIASPTHIALIASVISLTVKLLMFIATSIIAKRTMSGALKADAWHHLSDSLSSVGILIGVVGAMFGYEIMDILASVVICVVIFKVAIDIFVDAIKKMIDISAPEKTQEEIKNIIKEFSAVVGIQFLRTRFFGNLIYVEVEIFLDINSSFYNTYFITRKITNEIEERIEEVKGCKVYAIPIKLNINKNKKQNN